MNRARKYSKSCISQNWKSMSLKGSIRDMKCFSFETQVSFLVHPNRTDQQAKYLNLQCVYECDMIGMYLTIWNKKREKNANKYFIFCVLLWKDSVPWFHPYLCCRNLNQCHTSVLLKVLFPHFSLVKSAISTFQSC